MTLQSGASALEQWKEAVEQHERDACEARGLVVCAPSLCAASYDFIQLEVGPPGCFPSTSEYSP